MNVLVENLSKQCQILTFDVHFWGMGGLADWDMKKKKRWTKKVWKNFVARGDVSEKVVPAVSRI